MKTKVHSVEVIVWREDANGNKHRVSGVVRPGSYIHWENTDELRAENARLMNEFSKLILRENG
jgi:hypothetical protein